MMILLFVMAFRLSAARRRNRLLRHFPSRFHCPRDKGSARGSGCRFFVAFLVFLLLLIFSSPVVFVIFYSFYQSIRGMSSMRGITAALLPA
jgi:hypothetical protein